MNVKVLETLDKYLLWLLSLTVVAEIVLNFLSSYGHIYVEGMGYGERGMDGRILPVTIDGMLLALAIANVFAARFNRRSRWLRAGLVFGVGATVVANAAYGAHWGMTGGLFSTYAPVALFITVECGLFVWRIVADLVKEAKAKEAKPVEMAWTGDKTYEIHPAPASEAAPAAEQPGKAPTPSMADTQAWRGLSGIGLTNGQGR